MKSTKIRFYLNILIILAAVFLVFSCKATGVDTADTADTTDDGSSTPPPPTKYTVTIDPNTGDRGHVTSIPDISPGGTAAKPSDADLPTKTDSEIAYWSTEKDNYSKPFKFGETPINGNITIYPHWRTSLINIKNQLNGQWLVNNTLPNNKSLLYKLDTPSSSYAFCYKANPATFLLTDLTVDTSTLAEIKNMPMTYTLPAGTVKNNENNGTFIINGNSADFNLSTLSLPPSKCFYGSSRTFDLSYAAPDKDEIALILNNTNLTSYTKLTLTSYTSTQFVFDGISDAFTDSFTMVKQ